MAQVPSPIIPAGTGLTVAQFLTRVISGGQDVASAIASTSIGLISAALGPAGAAVSLIAGLGEKTRRAIDPNEPLNWIISGLASDPPDLERVAEGKTTFQQRRLNQLSHPDTPLPLDKGSAFFIQGALATRGIGVRHPMFLIKARQEFDTIGPGGRVGRGATARVVPTFFPGFLPGEIRSLETDGRVIAAGVSQRALYGDLTAEEILGFAPGALPTVEKKLIEKQDVRDYLRRARNQAGRGRIPGRHPFHGLWAFVEQTFLRETSVRGARIPGVTNLLDAPLLEIPIEEVAALVEPASLNLLPARAERVNRIREELIANPLARRQDPMALGFLEALGGGLTDLVGSFAREFAPVAREALSQTISRKIGLQPQRGFTTAPSGVAFPPEAFIPSIPAGPTIATPTKSRRRTSMGTDLRGLPIGGAEGFVGPVDEGFFGIPGFDLRSPLVAESTVAAQAGAAMSMLPFRVTRTGAQVAKPFQAIRANGSVEWFIPAGKPTAWSKASIKRRQHHHHPPQHRRRRKR